MKGEGKGYRLVGINDLLGNALTVGQIKNILKID